MGGICYGNEGGVVIVMVKGWVVLLRHYNSGRGDGYIKMGRVGNSYGKLRRSVTRNGKKVW